MIESNFSIPEEEITRSISAIENIIQESGSMHEKLQHLNEGQVSDLLEGYYVQEEKVSDLISKFEIDIIPSKLVSLFPPTVHDDLLCPYCEDESLASKAVSRNSHSSPSPKCLICSHEHKNYCRCKNCNAARREYEESKISRKQDIIFEAYYVDYPPCPSIDELSHIDALYLLSVIRHSADENFKHVVPFREANPELAPTFEFINDITKHLYSKGFIHICYDSDVEAFVFDDEETQTTAYYPARVSWRLLPSLTIDEKKKFIKELEKIVGGDSHPVEWRKDIISLWMKIAKFECIEYLIYSANQRNIPLDKIGQKTHSIFETVLESYSIGQVFNFIFQSAMSTNDYAIRENIPKYKAKNMFIGSIQRKADKAKAEGWTIKNSRRDFNCPQSVVSATFFDTFMGLGSAVLETNMPQIDES